MKRSLLGLIVAAAGFPVSVAIHAALVGNGNPWFAAPAQPGGASVPPPVPVPE